MNWTRQNQKKHRPASLGHVGAQPYTLSTLWPWQAHRSHVPASQFASVRPHHVNTHFMYTYSSSPQAQARKLIAHPKLSAHKLIHANPAHDAMRAGRKAMRDLMTWVTCKCIRVSLTRGWDVCRETCFQIGTSSPLHIDLPYIRQFGCPDSLFYALVCPGAIALLLLDFEANGRFEETTSPITRYVVLVF